MAVDFSLSQAQFVESFQERLENVFVLPITVVSEQSLTKVMTDS